MDVVQMMVALTILGVFIMANIFLFTRAIPEANRDVANHMIGILDAAFGYLVGFYFGSSKGSRLKDQKPTLSTETTNTNTTTIEQK